MRVCRNLTWGVLFAFTVSTLTQSNAVIAAPPADRPTMPRVSVSDIELAADHSLSGQVLDSAGRPLADTVVRVVRPGGSQTTTDVNGNFRLRNVGAGVVQLASQDGALAVRCWTHGAAPPTASKRVLLTPNEIQRGQRPIADFLTGPVLIGLIIAAAIAIPIAIHNSRDSAS